MTLNSRYDLKSQVKVLVGMKDTYVERSSNAPKRSVIQVGVHSYQLVCEGS